MILVKRSLFVFGSMVAVLFLKDVFFPDIGLWANLWVTAAIGGALGLASCILFTTGPR